MFCKITQNVTKYFGNFCAKIIQQELKKSPNLVTLNLPACFIEQLIHS